MKKELTLQRDLRKGQINPKLRILFHAGHFSSVTAARFFNLVRPPIIIIETGQSAQCIQIYIRVYTCIYVFIYTCYTCYSSDLSSPEQQESISLCNFCRGTASSFTHTDWTLHAHLHTQIGALHWPQRDLPRENWPPHATQCSRLLLTFTKGNL